MEVIASLPIWAFVLGVSFVTGWLVGNAVNQALGDRVHAVLLAAFVAWLGYGLLQMSGWVPVGMQVKDAHFGWLFYMFVAPPLLLGLGWPLLQSALREDKTAPHSEQEQPARKPAPEGEE